MPKSKRKADDLSDDEPRSRKRTTKNGSDSDAAGVSDDELGALDKSNILPTTSRRTRGKVVNYAQLNADLGPESDDDDDDSDDAPKKKKKAAPPKKGKLSSKMPNIGKSAKATVSPSRKKGIKKSRAEVDSDDEDEPDLGSDEDEDDDEQSAEETGSEQGTPEPKKKKPASKGAAKPTSKGGAKPSSKGAAKSPGRVKKLRVESDEE